MDQRTHTLFFQDVELGTITQSDADFPNCWGTFVPSQKADYPETRERIGRFIDHCREADQLMQLDDSPGGDWQEFIARREPAYRDLIESDDWKLVDFDGNEHPILVPNFCVGRVVWRWDPTR